MRASWNAALTRPSGLSSELGSTIRSRSGEPSRPQPHRPQHVVDSTRSRSLRGRGGRLSKELEKARAQYTAGQYGKAAKTLRYAQTAAQRDLGRLKICSNWRPQSATAQMVRRSASVSRLLHSHASASTGTRAFRLRLRRVISTGLL